MMTLMSEMAQTVTRTMMESMERMNERNGQFVGQILQQSHMREMMLLRNQVQLVGGFTQSGYRLHPNFTGDGALQQTFSTV